MPTFVDPGQYLKSAINLQRQIERAFQKRLTGRERLERIGGQQRRALYIVGIKGELSRGNQR